MVAHLRFAHGISTSFLPRFGLFKVVVSSLLNLSINERGGREPRLPRLPPLATSLSRINTKKCVRSVNRTVSGTHKEVTEAYETPVFGCGLLLLVPFFQDHYKDDQKRFNKIPVRLIGEQAVSIARYGYRLVDSLQLPDEPPPQEVKRLSLSRIVLYLRNACTTSTKSLQQKLSCRSLKKIVNSSSISFAYSSPLMLKLAVGQSATLCHTMH